MKQTYFFCDLTAPDVDRIQSPHSIRLMNSKPLYRCWYRASANPYRQISTVWSRSGTKVTPTVQQLNVFAFRNCPKNRFVRARVAFVWFHPSIHPQYWCRDPPRVRLHALLPARPATMLPMDEYDFYQGYRRRKSSCSARTVIVVQCPREQRILNPIL